MQEILSRAGPCWACLSGLPETAAALLPPCLGHNGPHREGGPVPLASTTQQQHFSSRRPRLCRGSGPAPGGWIHHCSWREAGWRVPRGLPGSQSCRPSREGGGGSLGAGDGGGAAGAAVSAGTAQAPRLPH